ncbi:hypothetical protein N7478_010899 [Penicillium angulare]|uniref:uncharacterized protein n=1 Tax=Penicillium angulare TaxID=116970 RepID=UPI002541DEB0|nr:uncharacterized protein N7478_010899 [Penicillium angulare]KAJ5263294.1 hypothetical protein N7478_010899 [Penicillium angulare]
MLLAFITLIIYVLSSVGAFSLYGGYERIFYYNAYLADAEINGGEPKKIAVGCSNTGTCTFDRFIQFINGLDRPPKLPKSPDLNIHKAADDLDKKQLTGVYIVKRVSKKAENVAKLFEEVSTRPQGMYTRANLSMQISCFMDERKTKELNQLWESARASIEVVCFLRKAANSDKLKQVLELEGIDPIMKPERYECEEKLLIDEMATIQKYEPQDVVDVAKLIVKFHRDEKSHETNIRCACWSAVRLHRRSSAIVGDVFQSGYNDEECWEENTCLKDDVGNRDHQYLETQFDGRSEAYRCKEL